MDEEGPTLAPQRPGRARCPRRLSGAQTTCACASELFCRERLEPASQFVSNTSPVVSIRRGYSLHIKP